MLCSEDQRVEPATRYLELFFHRHFALFLLLPPPHPAHFPSTSVSFSFIIPVPLKAEDVFPHIYLGETKCMVRTMGLQKNGRL